MRKNNGFTLIELLVAMGIVAVLTGMSVFNFNQSRVKARDLQRKNDLTELQKALELYKNDNNAYPAANGFQATLKTGLYTKTTFNDPKGADWVTYAYLPVNNNKSYYLMSCLESNTDPMRTTDDTVCGLFTSETTDKCKCGLTASSRTGNMYIITQP